MGTSSDEFSSPDPGWYTNPEDPGMLRLWNGREWTDEVKPHRPPPAGSPLEPYLPPPSGSPVIAESHIAAPAAPVAPENRGRSDKGPLILAVIAVILGPVAFLWPLPFVAVGWSLRQFLKAQRGARTMLGWALGVSLFGVLWLAIIKITGAVNA